MAHRAEEGNSRAFPDILVEDVETKSGRSLGPHQPLLGDAFALKVSPTDNRLTYTLVVTAASTIAAKYKARRFVRYKNPFEPSQVAIHDTKLLKGVSDFRNKYRLLVSIDK